MSELSTNRDLYRAIEDLNSKHMSTDRTLEEYLRALIVEAEAFANSDAIPIDKFYDILQRAYTTSPADFDETWRDQYDDLPRESPGYVGWQATLIKQIVDLHEMRECGTYENDNRYAGVAAPRGPFWYNFDVGTYLECAVCGTFGGWEQGDDPGRSLVQHPVAISERDGAVRSMDPMTIPRLHSELPAITWEDFERFIFNGRICE